MPQVDELELVTTKRFTRFRLQSSESVSEEVELGSDDAAALLEEDDNEADEDDHLLSSGGKITNRYKSGNNNLEPKKRYFIIYLDWPQGHIFISKVKFMINNFGISWLKM